MASVSSSTDLSAMRLSLVIHRAPGATRRHHELASDGPGPVRGQEGRDVRDLRCVYHAPDGVASRGIVSEVLLLDFLGGDVQLRGAGGEQTRGGLRARRAGVNAVDRDS